MGWGISEETRKIYLTGQTEPTTFPSNKLNSQKYNFATFIPLVLFNQFKYFFNLFFLILTLSQFIPILKVGKFATY